jgi:hypothetical protein
MYGCIFASAGISIQSLSTAYKHSGEILASLSKHKSCFSCPFHVTCMDTSPLPLKGCKRLLIIAKTSSLQENGGEKILPFS